MSSSPDELLSPALVGIRDFVIIKRSIRQLLGNAQVFTLTLEFKTKSRLPRFGLCSVPAKSLFWMLAESNDPKSINELPVVKFHEWCAEDDSFWNNGECEPDSRVHITFKCCEPNQIEFVFARKSTMSVGYRYAMCPIEHDAYFMIFVAKEDFKRGHISLNTTLGFFKRLLKHSKDGKSDNSETNPQSDEPRSLPQVTIEINDTAGDKTSPEPTETNTEMDLKDRSKTSKELSDQLCRLSVTPEADRNNLQFPLGLQASVPSISPSPSLTDAPVEESPVLQIRGIEQRRFTCDRIFNLLCSFGDCLKVLFPYQNVHYCLVEMKDVSNAQNVIHHLNKCKLFGDRLDIQQTWPKIPVENPPASLSFKLPVNNSPSFKSFVGNVNLRFSNSSFAGKNKSIGPSQQLHFFNAPPSLKNRGGSRQIRQLFEEHSLRTLKITFTKGNNSQRSSSGFIVLRSVEDATAGLALCNHKPMDEPGAKNPYFFKLCFAHN
ncbi:RNA recognition motif domain-containing protein [Ditylenchus destructor]|uniref:RNA recognition motif domain-containing protein n=1 Tax=Ditylenchus destructor TaxID=166010 RepID=A0AAD4MTY4_9BILA|nr:RNA recognition motif domain-containing protein [Ditylenchus destructor]